MLVCAVQISLGGVSTNMTFAQPRFKREEKEPNISHRWKSKRRSSTNPSSSATCARHFSAKQERDDVKTLINDYAQRPEDIPYYGRYSDPPNEKGIAPHPHKRATMEYRPFNLINF